MNDHVSHRNVTRREFVKTSSAAIAGASIALPAFARSVHVGHTDTLRVGLVGCGGRGTGAARQALHADPNTRLTAMADAFADKIDWSLGQLRKDQAIADRLDVEGATRFSGFNAYRNLIDSGIDVVLLATPPVFRPIHLAYAIERGKHVFTEKPMAVDAPGVRSVIAMSSKAREKGLAIMSGFCWRRANHMRDTYERLHGGGVGEIRAMQSQYNTGPLGDVARKPGWSDMEWQLRNWKAFIHLSGDHIVEQAVHAIDWIHWVFNDDVPVRAFAVGGRQARAGEWTGNMYDHFGVTYEFSNGRRGYHMCRQIAHCANDNTGFIIGSTGTCSINPGGPRCVIEGDNPWRWQGERNDMYQTEHDELFASIRAGEPINDGRWMADSTMMAILGREAAYTGQTITWERIMSSEKSYAPERWEWGDAEFPEVPVPGVTKVE